MKVVFLSASTSRSAGGLYFTITALTKALYSKGIDITVVGFDDVYSKEDRSGFGDVPVIAYHRYNIPIIRSFGYSSDLMKILEMLSPDIIHLQGLWMYHSWAALKYKKRHQEVKIVIEPHGMLDPWAVKNSFWKKKIVGYLFEYKNLKKADCLHALCKSELESIRSFGLKNRVVIIPNGINISATFDIPKRNIIQYIGRIHPKKGLDLLVQAVSLLALNHKEILDGWKVRIAGWDQNGYRTELEKKVVDLGITGYIEFSGPRFGLDKDKDFSESKAFILPSYSEGLPMSILEAWSFRLPVIMTEYCNLPEGFEANAAIKIQTTPQSVAEGLLKFLQLSDVEQKKIGENGYLLVSSRFTWDSIASKTIEMYEWHLNDIK